MTFASAARRENREITYTENGARALGTTGSSLLDLFATIGAMRETDEEIARQMFLAAMIEDKLLAVKMLFYARNPRGGLKERKVPRNLLTFLASIDPKTVEMNMELIPFFGRWDDLYSLIDTPLEGKMWSFIKKTLTRDIELATSGKRGVSLCAKWLKSVNTSSADSRRLGRLTAKKLGWTESYYRRVLSGLRSVIGVVEQKMSKNDWSGIVYPSVPSRTMKICRKAFAKHDEARFSQFIENVKTGKVTINAATLFPYDILIAGNLRSTYRSYARGGETTTVFTMDDDPVLEAQWNALPNYVSGENNILVMSDTSGSMENPDGIPMASSVGLAVYFAERNKGAYKDLFLTFSGEPKFVTLKGQTLKEKLSCVPAIVSNTDLEKAFELILQVAIDNNVSQEEMPSTLVVISDMQFDASKNYGWSWEKRTGRKGIFSDVIKARFASAGYQMPVVVYWQVSKGDAGTFQTETDEKNVILVSGHSTSSFKNLLGSVGMNPWEFMLKVLNDPMYDVVKV